MIRHAGKRWAVLRLLAAIDVPMAIGHRMCLGPLGDRVQQQRQSVVRIDSPKIDAMGTQVAKQGRVIRRNALPNHGKPKPAHGQRLRGRRRRSQPIAIQGRSVAIRIELMRSPKVSR